MPEVPFTRRIQSMDYLCYRIPIERTYEWSICIELTENKVKVNYLLYYI